MTFRDHLFYWSKVGVAYAMYYLGIFRCLQRIVLRNKAVVLMYHRVLSPDQRRCAGSHPGLVVTRRTFSMQMAVLKRRFKVLTLEEFADHVTRRVPFEPSSCVITFDDGWQDTYTNAFPILREHDLAALVFLPVNYIGRQRFFPREALTHLLVAAVRAVREGAASAAGFREVLGAADLESGLALEDEDPRPAIVRLLADRPHVRGPVITRLIADLEARLGVRAEELSDADTFMDWHQVAFMSRHRISFGGHGAEHAVLTDAPQETVYSEIRTSREVIESRFQGQCPAFSYPAGAWTPAIADRVRSSGYRLAFTTDAGLVSCEDDPFTLRRINIHEDVTDSPPMFLARVVGLF